MSELTILVPLCPPHGCQLCLPIPRDYADHAGLVKHLKHVHSTTLCFECRACGYTHDKLKIMKAHQLKSDSCRTRIEALSPPPPPLPADRKKVCIPTRPRKPYVRRKQRPSQDTSPGSNASQDSIEADTPSPPLPASRRRCTTRRSRPLPAHVAENNSPPSSLSSPSSTPPRSQPRWSRTTRPIQAILEESQSTETADNVETAPISAPVPASSQSPTYAQVLQSSPPSTTATPSHHTNENRQSPQHPSSTREEHLSPSGRDQVRVLSPPSSPTCAPAPTQESHRHDATTDSTSPPSWVTAWISRFDAAIDEDILEGVLKDFVELAHQICNIRTPQPQQQHPRHRRSSSEQHHNSQLEASMIQRLYRANRKRAYDQILGGPPASAILIL
ncbi:flocculation protein FLO11-like [Centruroides sculpturatus]|uniref:flocculation protein FLO11-like n=1 Tax=Centruroides sculpturatus TaxID=218467 RepID=UPI000C6E3E99|nr:flocculation protein FLO11-like [Centruroides sculpturatus]